MPIFLDIETTGFPERLGFNQYYDYKQVEKYDKSRVISFCFILDDNKGNILSKCTYTIKPDNFIIENSHIHGITQENAQRNGVLFHSITSELTDFLKKADTIVGHNIDFDINIFCSELYRRGYNDIASTLYSKSRSCTMEMGRGVTRLPGFKGLYKAPKLTELYSCLFGEELKGLHNAENDTINCMKCYNKMQKK